MKFLITLLIVIAFAAAQDQPASLLQKKCERAQDCYLIPGRLELGCWYNVKRCNCFLTYQTIHHVESVNGQCLMSKFGPCSSANGTELTVGCLDGFQCNENQCRPASTTAGNNERVVPPETPVQFCRPCSDGCEFDENLRFSCSRSRPGGPDPPVCECKAVFPADTSGPVWDVRNYHGSLNCSVGKFGPCGDRNGIKVDCHGAGIECVNGRCVDPKKLVGQEGERCDLNSDCVEGLRCSASYRCVKPGSLDRGASCKADDDCKPGLKCTFKSWSSSCA